MESCGIEIASPNNRRFRLMHIKNMAINHLYVA